MSHFDDLLIHIHGHSEGWQNRFLSIGAHLLLLRHVVSSIPVHLLSVLYAPKTVVASLNRIMSNFLGGPQMVSKSVSGWLGRRFSP